MRELGPDVLSVVSTPAFNDWNILLQYSDEYTVEFLSLFHLFFNLDLYLLGDDTSIR